MRLLVLGATGMLGNAVLRLFSEDSNFETFGTIRSVSAAKYFDAELHGRLISGVDVESVDSLFSAFKVARPDVVVNCVGLVKQLAQADDPLAAIPMNSILPHRLARLCEVAGARFIHMSTDCVYSGSKGMYVETDVADASDLYGRSKLLGEVDYANSVTLRTSIIGHELDGARSLVGWFLSQEGPVKGYRRAVFSGLPTVEIARIIRDFVIPNATMRGTYHVSAEPINKFDLLELVAKHYGKKITIVPDDDFVIDRSLDSTRFRGETGFYPKSWSELIVSMRNFG